MQCYLKPLPWIPANLTTEDAGSFTKCFDGSRGIFKTNVRHVLGLIFLTLHNFLYFSSSQLFQHYSFARWNVSIWPCSTKIAWKAVFRKCAPRSTKMGEARCHLMSHELIMPLPIIFFKNICSTTSHIWCDTLSQNLKLKCPNSQL